MKIKDMLLFERPREKMVFYGKEALSNAELLALLIKTGTSKESALNIAEKMLNINAEGLRGLSENSVEELSQFEGIGIAKASVILAAVELGKRISAWETLDRQNIKSVHDVVDIFMENMRYLKKEYFETLLLDAKGSIIAKETISVGDLCSSIVHPRETFKSAVKRSAAAVIFVHNHPSGDPSPSDEDVKTTNRLIEVGNILGISVLDHIIIGDGTFISMKSKGMI